MASLLDLWRESTENTPWSHLNVQRELENAERLACRPRIPDDHLIFRVFRAFNDPANQIKVILLGQDPYPEMLEIPDSQEEGSVIAISRACGFSFSSPCGSLPLSLRTIFSEILREYPQPLVEGIGRRSAKPAVPSDYSGDLSYLVADGVFLLNTFLTINFDGIRGQPLSHTSWLAFTAQVLNFIRRLCPRAVYLALGKKAADLLKASGINDAIETDHPANRFGGRNPFNGSDIFIKANASLQKHGVEPIDWLPMKAAVDCKYYDSSVQPGTSRQIVSIAPPEIPLPSEFGVSIAEEEESDESN